ncbi:MAG: ABC transporter ATP-binding protein [Oscillospiraceae bacterium]|nr:ABC transporter ATP-binding protein [Oscillospiraceae bacterium]
MNAIEIKGLTKRYPGFTLDHVDLTVPGGCVVGLIGENGAGKTTLIRLLLDLIRPDSGEISVLGRPTAELAAVKEELGIVLDEPGLPAALNARQLGKMLRDAYRSWDESAWEDCLRRFSIPADRKFAELSNGTKMKLSLAAALSHNARLLILDEATSGLDPVVRDEVVDILMEFTRDEGHSILISSHIVSDLEKLCDYIAFLHKGKLIVFEEKDVLASEYGLFRGTAEELAALPAEAVLHRVETPYGVTAAVRRDAAAAGTALSPVSIEELFVMMAKEMK